MNSIGRPYDYAARTVTRYILRNSRGHKMGVDERSGKLSQVGLSCSHGRRRFDDHR